MTGEGPFLWLSERGSPHGYHRIPRGGLCLSAFLFVTRGEQILLGRYADDPAWARLAGLDEERRRIHGSGWTVPASHLKLGEDPREAARRVAEEILGLRGLRLSEPRVETDAGLHPRFPEVGLHQDFWFFVEAPLPEDADLPRPPWYAELAFHDPARLPDAAYARCHEEIVARWRAARTPA